jgi:[ribosomal protein S5]-alanine N-acetyltransferase
VSAAPRLETERLVLTIPEPASAARLLAYAVDNRAHLDPWEPPRPGGYYTEAFWARRLEKSHDESARDVSLRLCVLRKSDPEGPILGHANLSNFVRNAFQACHLGYSVDRRAQGKGIMFEALAAVIAHAFGPLGMHRVMANYVPTNERSGKLLRRLGFVVEGYARDYLFIGGAWRDHVLTALTNPAPTPPQI